MLDVYHSVGIHQMYKHVHSYLDALGSSAWNTNFLALLLYLHLHASTAVNTAPIMTSFGSCRGPGAAKWDYTAGYFVRSQWRGSACKGGHTIGMLIDWFDSLRGSPSSKTPCHWKHLSEPMEEKLFRTSVLSFLPSPLRLMERLLVCFLFKMYQDLERLNYEIYLVKRGKYWVSIIIIRARLSRWEYFICNFCQSNKSLSPNLQTCAWT